MTIPQDGTGQPPHEKTRHLRRKVMGVATKQLAGTADGRAISAAVKALLG